MRCPTLLAGLTALGLTVSTCTVVSAQEPIADLQALLIEHGCSAGAADGVWGPRTAAAAAAFAAASGTAIDRPITSGLIDTLRQSAARCAAADDILAHYLPQDVLATLKQLPPGTRARVCQGNFGTRARLAQLGPEDRIQGHSSQMMDTNNLSYVMNEFGFSVSAVATAAFVRGDDAQKSFLIKMLAKWARAGAYLKTVDCSNSDCGGEWHSKRGKERAPVKDWVNVEERLIPIAFAYYTMLRDYKPDEFAGEHAAIDKWLREFQRRLPSHARATKSELTWDINWQTWGYPLFDLLDGRDAAFKARLSNVAGRLGEVLLPDGSFREHTTRGSRAAWYHFRALGETFFALEMLLANGTDLYPQFEDRLEKAVAILLDTIDDLDAGRNDAMHPARIYEWAKTDWHSAGEPTTQTFRPMDYWGWGYTNWVFVYLHRFPHTVNAERLRALIARFERLPEGDNTIGLNVGCLYRLGDPGLLAREQAVEQLDDAALAQALSDLLIPSLSRAELKAVSLRQSDVIDSYSLDIVNVFINNIEDVLHAGGGDQSRTALNVGLYADYSGSAKTVDQLQHLRLHFGPWNLDEGSRKARFDKCDPLVYGPADIRLAYGPDAASNDCILSQMSEEDREFWTAVHRRLPEIIHAGAAGNEAAAKLDQLFTSMVSQKSGG